MTNRSKAV